MVRKECKLLQIQILPFTSSKIYGTSFFIMEDLTTSESQSSFFTSFIRTSCSPYLNFTLLLPLDIQESLSTNHIINQLTICSMQLFQSLFMLWLITITITRKQRSKTLKTIYLMSITLDNTDSCLDFDNTWNGYLKVSYFLWCLFYWANTCMESLPLGIKMESTMITGWSVWLNSHVWL